MKKINTIKIKDIEIPIEISNYKTSRTMKLYFKNGVLKITKSPYIPKYEVDIFVKKNEEFIYEEYKKVLEQKRMQETKWQTGRNTLYCGEYYEINKIYHKENFINIKIDSKNKIFNIFIPEGMTEKETNENVKKLLRKLYKNNTEIALKQRLPYWEKKTNLFSSNVKVQDAKTKFGSCRPQTKELHFSSRLIMLKPEAIDAVIVHELCHIVHANHSKKFYDLVQMYIPNYKELDKYLKEKSKDIRNVF